MCRIQDLKLLSIAVLLKVLCLVFAGCGGNSGSSQSGSASRTSKITIQLLRATAEPRVLPAQGRALGQARQVQPGDAGFIERLRLQFVQPNGALLSQHNFTLDASQQETITLDIELPTPLPVTMRLVVSGFNNFGGRQTEIFLGETTLELGQQQAEITLVRNTTPSGLVPLPATPSNLQQTTFTFLDGTAFGFAGIATTLATGTFTDNTGDFTLIATEGIASGEVTIGSCTFTVVESTFLLGRGVQVGEQIFIDPCEIDAIDGRMIATTAAIRSNRSFGIPTPVTSTGILVLPALFPTLEVDENTVGTVSVGAALGGSRPGNLTFALTRAPSHGTASLQETGVVTYRPETAFHGSDRLVVTATATFTDGNTPALLLGLVPISITVRPVQGATVRIGAPTAPVQLGTTFTVPVELNIAATSLLSYLLELTFDPTVIRVLQIDQGSSLFGTPVTNPAAFTSGTVRFAANNSTFAPATGQFTLAHITFQVVGTTGQISPLQLRLPANGVLVDSAFHAINSVTFLDSTVQIN